MCEAGISKASRDDPPQKHRQNSATTSTGKDYPICNVHISGLRKDKYGLIKLLSLQDNPQAILAKLHQIKTQRLSKPMNSPYRMTAICNQITDVLARNHGYHRECYKRFTMNLNRLSNKPEDIPSVSKPAKRYGDNVLFAPDCIFCNSANPKKVKINGSWTTEGLSLFQLGGANVEEVAKQKQDRKLLSRIRRKNLVACKAKYHHSCQKQYYLSDPVKWHSKNAENKDTQMRMEEIHKLAFDKVCEIIDKDILEQKT